MRFEGFISAPLWVIRLTVESQQRALRTAVRAAGKAVGKRCRSPVSRSASPAHCIDPGRLAQLGERLVYTQKVGGSIPSPPIVVEHSPGRLGWLSAAAGREPLDSL